MCGKNKELFFILLLFLLFCFVLGALRAEETERWYLITETELRNIEQYKENSEREKRNWQLQVQILSKEANILLRESIDLNGQLAQARAQNRRLATLFNEYVQGQLIQISLKNGEIADLRQEKDSEIVQLTQANAKKIKIISIMGGVLGIIAAYLIIRLVLWIKGGFAAFLINKFL